MFKIRCMTYRSDTNTLQTRNKLFLDHDKFVE